MADPTPTGERGKAKENLRNLLAESTAFQVAIGATGTPTQKIAAAKLRLHRTAYVPEEDPGFERPFGLLCSMGNDKSEKRGGFLMGGDIELRLEKDIPAEYKDDPENAEIDFENFYEGVMLDAMNLSGQPGYFAINSWDVIEGPAQVEIDEGKFVGVIRILVNWGIS